MAVLQRTLAQKLGVSPMTISRALRGESGISEVTRKKILEAARHAGLALPPSKKRVAAQDLLHVLCTMAASGNHHAETPFHRRLLDGLARGGRECAAEIVNCPEETDVWPAVVARRQVDGVVLVWGDEHNRIPRAPCPVTQVYIFHGPPQADVVSVDNVGGGAQLGRHLAATGHRKVAFIGPDTWVARERLAGLRIGLETEVDSAPSVMPQLLSGGRGQSPEHIDHLLQSLTHRTQIREHFTAIVAYNDWLAIQAINRLQTLGLRVPRDISVTGFDDVVPTGYNGPRLTTCAIPLEELGAEAARFVYWRIEHPGAVRRKLALETEFIAGETVARV